MTMVFADCLHTQFYVLASKEVKGYRIDSNCVDRLPILMLPKCTTSMNVCTMSESIAWHNKVDLIIKHTGISYN